MKKRFFIISMAAISITVVADEIPVPDFKNPPQEYTNEHDIVYKWNHNREEHVHDRLLIGDVNNRQLTFYVETTGNNHHMCYVAGDAKKKGNSYLFTYKRCQLQIKIYANRAMLSDVGGECRKYFCGMMGYLQAQFTKK